MKPRGKRLSGVLVGLAVQGAMLPLLLRGIFDMHNRFSARLSLVLPYAGIADRLTDPPGAVMLLAAIVSLSQFALYGAVIGHAWAKGRLAPALGCIAAIHATAAAIAIYLRS